MSKVTIEIKCNPKRGTKKVLPSVDNYMCITYIYLIPYLFLFHSLLILLI